MRRSIAILVACIGSAHIATAQTELIGRTVAQVIAIKGEPLSKATIGSKAIYRWSDAELKLSDGIVTSVTLRDLEKEKIDAERAGQLATASKQRAAEIENARRENYRAQQAEAQRIDAMAQKTKKEQQERFKALEQRNAEHRLLSAQIATARQEANRLRTEIRRDYSNGQNTLNKRLELSAKENEIKELEKAQSRAMSVR